MHYTQRTCAPAAGLIDSFWALPHQHYSVVGMEALQNIEVEYMQPLYVITYGNWTNPSAALTTLIVFPQVSCTLQ